MRADRADAPLKRAPLVRAAADPRSFPWKTGIIHSEWSRELVKKTQDEHFSDDVRGFRQCVWSVRFYAVSTTWTSSLLPCPPPPPPAPVPSELPWQREEAGHTARLIFGQCKQGDTDLCKITQRFRLLRWETRKWIFTDRMTQILGSWEDLRYKSVRRVVGSHDFISNSYFFR